MQAGLGSPFSPTRVNPCPALSNPNRAGPQQRGTEEPGKGLEPRCHLPRAGDPKTSARKDAAVNSAETTDKPLGLEPFTSLAPLAVGGDSAPHIGIQHLHPEGTPEWGLKEVAKAAQGLAVAEEDGTTWPELPSSLT